ncbi:MAG: hypothetical protein IJC47_01805 [Alistipes sp.]|nr:hypothetical protein [Alistipes sp.]
MKIWKLFLMSPVFAVATIGFTACGGDDDNGGGDPRIVGKWVDPDWGDYYQFNGNGTCIYDVNEPGEAADQGTYTFNGTTVAATFIYEGEADTETLTYHEGTRPYLSDEYNAKYYKQ